MSETTRLADEFLQWWLAPETVPDFSSRLAPGFTYRMEPAGLCDADAVWFVQQHAPWESVTIKSQGVSGDTATITLEGTDPVTGLRHRASWTIRTAEDRIASVVERIESVG